MITRWLVQNCMLHVKRDVKSTKSQASAYCAEEWLWFDGHQVKKNIESARVKSLVQWSPGG